VGASAQTTLRVGLAEDPDVLDPTLARTYVGRIVFSALCDKLFDIDEKLNIVPQLALSMKLPPTARRLRSKLRPGVKFQDGEPFDAEAAEILARSPPDDAGLVPKAGTGGPRPLSTSSNPLDHQARAEDAVSRR